MRSSFLVFIALAFLAVPLHADRQANADYIVSQVITRTIFEGAIVAQRPVIIGAIQNELREKGITLPEPDRFFDLFMVEFLDEFTESMQAQSAAIYLDNFSEQELTDIAIFFKTASGQAYIAASPVLMLEGARMGQRAGERAGRNAAKRLAERIERENLIVFDDPGVLQRLLNILK